MGFQEENFGFLDLGLGETRLVEVASKGFLGPTIAVVAASNLDPKEEEVAASSPSPMEEVALDNPDPMEVAVDIPTGVVAADTLGPGPKEVASFAMEAFPDSSSCLSCLQIAILP